MIFSRKPPVSSKNAFSFPARSQRTVIRPFTDDDVPQIARWIADLNGSAMHPLFAQSEARDYLAHIEERDRHHLAAGVFDLRGQLLGRVSAYALDGGSPDWEIGYYLLTDSRGQGYMTEALNCLKDTFRAASVRAMYATINIKNEKSCGVVQRAGFAEYVPHDGEQRYFRYIL